MKTLLSGLVAVVMAIALSACSVGGTIGGGTYTHDGHHGYHHDRHGYHHDGGKHHVKHHRDHHKEMTRKHSEKVVKETKVEKK
jgi:hypothetical protein